MKQTFFSKKLGTDVELDVVAVNDRAMLISSASLERTVERTEVKALGLQVVVLWDNTKVSADHKCVIYEGYAQDNERAYSPMNGEANPTNCDTPISKAYPARMALKRLKDACIIGWLDLETEGGKVIYTNNETSTLEDGTVLPASIDELAALVDDTTETSVSGPSEDELAALINGDDEDIATATADDLTSFAEDGVADTKELNDLLKKSFKVRGETHTIAELFTEEGKSLASWLLKTEFRENTSLFNTKSYYLKAKKLKEGK